MAERREAELREPTPPAYPLTREQFAEALAKGLGRAHLHVQRHGAAGVDDLILDACLHNRAYDPECEDERAPWLADLIDAAGLQGQILPALLASLRDMGEAPHWDRVQRCGLAAQFAGRGHTVARDALYAAFRESVERDDPIGAGDIIALDGADGLIAVVNALGQRLLTNPSLDVEAWRMRHFDDEAGPGRARAILERAATKNAGIGRYLARAEETEREAPPQKPQITLAEIIAAIDDPAVRFSRYFHRVWGKRATESELEVIAQRLATVPSPAALVRCLMCFQRRPYARLMPRFLELTEHTDPDVRRAAIAALSQITHADVRALALGKIEGGHVAEGELDLFARNYATGDEDRFVHALIALPADACDRHDAWMDVLNVFDSNSHAVAHPCMLWLYERTPCPTCRSRAVRKLLRANSAPAWLMEEGRFDASADTRELCHKAGASENRPAS